MSIIIPTNIQIKCVLAFGTTCTTYTFMHDACRFGIRKGADDPEMVPHGHDFDEDTRKRNVVEFFVMIGRLDLRPGEMFFNHDERPGFFWSFLLAVQVNMTFDF